MTIIRIYMTDSGPEGYHEGCSCCSSEELVELKDIQELILHLESEVSELRELEFLTKKHGTSQLGTWYQQYSLVKNLTKQLEAAIKYRDNPTIQGTYYKDCFDRMDEISFQLEQANRQYMKLPAKFRKYVEK